MVMLPLRCAGRVAADTRDLGLEFRSSDFGVPIMTAITEMIRHIWLGFASAFPQPSLVGAQFARLQSTVGERVQRGQGANLETDIR